MYENFAFAERDKAVTGYHFPCENPSHVLCIIHGVGEHAGRYLRMADALGKKGIAVVSMDLRGHGISTGVRGDTAPRKEVLLDVDALISHGQQLYPGLPMTLYGHSMGGNIGLDYIARGNNRQIPDKYIISAPWIKLVMAVPGPLLPVARAAAKVLPKMTIDQKIDESALGNLNYVKPYKQDPLVHSRISLRCAVDGFDIGNAIYDGSHSINQYAEGKPFLLMHGDADKICDVEGSRALSKRLLGREGFDYIEWQGYCHEIHNGGPDTTGDEVIEKIGQFILE